MAPVDRSNDDAAADRIRGASGDQSRRADSGLGFSQHGIQPSTSLTESRTHKNALNFEMPVTSPEQLQRRSQNGDSSKGIRDDDVTSARQEEELPARQDMETPDEEASLPLFHPGLYSASGIDVMGILIRVQTRWNPKIDLGLIDSSCALLLCDARKSDNPIIYCSEPFEILTGYSRSEILGRNCRFLQSPDGRDLVGVRRQRDDEKIWALKKSIAAYEETQTTITNYKKGGQPFKNILTTIPLYWNSNEVQYIVGFQVARSASGN
ncbi:MAG: blue light receptor [Claussenomyces sp. TS43310]|nr:MAG: blue light receptor [Claussenomyces sp. TS43310]